MTRLRSRFAAVSLALAAATSLVACGGGGDDPTTLTAQSEGTVSSRSADFQKYSGKGTAKLRIAEFGIEASSEDRIDAQRAIEAYLRATNAGNWGRACNLVSDVLKGQIAEISRQSEEAPEPTCGEVLETLALVSGGQIGDAPVLAPRGIASLRIKEGPGGGFALFHGSDGKDHWMTVKRENGEWKVLSAAPQPFG